MMTTLLLGVTTVVLAVYGCPLWAQIVSACAFLASAVDDFITGDH
jgi:hypothetical protein